MDKWVLSAVYWAGAGAGQRDCEREVVDVANEQNLRPIKTLSKEEAKRRGHNGGKASAAARRQRKTLRETMNMLLSLPVTDAKEFNKLTNMGVDIEGLDNSLLLVLALFNKAKSGDVAAFKEIRDLIGEAADDTKLTKLDELLEEFRNAVE